MRYPRAPFHLAQDERQARHGAADNRKALPCGCCSVLKYLTFLAPKCRGTAPYRHQPARIQVSGALDERNGFGAIPRTIKRETSASDTEDDGEISMQGEA